MEMYREVHMSDMPYSKGPGLALVVLLAVLLFLAVVAAWGMSAGEFSNWMM